MARDETASDRGSAAIAAIVAAGRLRGFDAVTEYPVSGGRIDVVWLCQPQPAIPGVDQPLPVAGFEVESSWRTRKHLKGDFLNLADLATSLGVLVLLGDGPDVDATRQFAEAFTARHGSRIVVWSDVEVEALARGGQTDLPARVEEESDSDPGPAARHTGKYRQLWAWLISQAGETTEINVTFDEIEEIIGFPLPPSSREHTAHWSSYQGSAVVRAIHDAGFIATKVSLSAESLTLVRSR